MLNARIYRTKSDSSFIMKEKRDLKLYGGRYLRSKPSQYMSVVMKEKKCIIKITLWRTRDRRCNLITTRS